MVPTGTVRVQLVDAQGQPFIPARLGQSHVSIQEADHTGVGSWGGGAAVDTNGVCVFGGVPPGRYRLSDKPLFGQQKETNANEILLTVEARPTTEVRLSH